jgi:enoyl-CoA hydratase/carnithine racemase
MARADPDIVAPPGPTISVRIEDDIALVRLERPAKRNAIDTATVSALEAAFTGLPESVHAAVLSGAGAHFCAGLDLSDIRESTAAEAMFHSRLWHRAFDNIQFGRVPVVAVLHGAVVGGGLELAAATHIRVAERSAFYALPEGQRGIFLGGGGTARLSRIIGVPAIIDMMLTGRSLSAEEGHGLRLSQYLVEPDAGVEQAVKLARKIAANTPLTNYAVMHALPRIAEMAQEHGLLMEAMISSIVQEAPEAKARLQAFLDKRGRKVEPPQ